MSSQQQSLLTVDIERRGYGRRYSSLPVDERTRDGFMIDFEGARTRPDQIDIQPGDTVRWRDGERHIEGIVEHVSRTPTRLIVAVGGATPLPPEGFYF
ncbi:MAG TPA: hypothetical protein PKA05_18660 [Roseiflexaceae bacterium]|nr:hypothetical protein [Roseiflexaceae bacterium]HMP42407.1 hypothetical protein [Roseiflexaceae bacterium]